MAHFVVDDAVAAARLHSDAALVESLGAAGSGLPPERVRELIAAGALTPEQVDGLRVSSGPFQLDPWLVPVLMGVLAAQVARTAPDQVPQMRKWSLGRWLKRIGAMLVGRVPPPEHPAPHTRPPEPVAHDGDVPPPPPPPAAPGPAFPIPSPPPGLTQAEREAWIQARTRGGEFIRGLGNRVDERLHTTIREKWSGEDIIQEADREERLATREVVREQVAEAVARRKTVEDLASDLGHATDDWARDWKRIAKTEMQGAYSEGVIIDAVREDGPNALVARVPEAGACEHCQRVFLAGGRPRIFTVRELVANGTNAGRRARDWKATAWPVHPNCRCDTQAVPAGMVFDDRWLLKPAPAEGET